MRSSCRARRQRTSAGRWGSGHFTAEEFRRYDLSLAVTYVAERFDELPEIGPGVRQLVVGADAAIACPYYRVFVVRALDDPFGLVVVMVDIGPQSVDPDD